MRVRIVVVAVIVAVMALVLQSGASATGAIRIHEIYYNSPGSDDGSNPSLNAEWVQLHNTASKASSLKGWTLRDAGGHVYHFPSAYKLWAGGYVKIHTGHGSNTQKNLYWGSGSYIWNNDGDTATLKRPNGTVADRCHYSDSSESGSHVFC